jgi:hypothetical protein
MPDLLIYARLDHITVTFLVLVACNCTVAETCCTLLLELNPAATFGTQVRPQQI